MSIFKIYSSKRYLHAVELQTAIRTGTRFLGLAPPHGIAALCACHCSCLLYTSRPEQTSVPACRHPEETVAAAGR